MEAKSKFSGFVGLSKSLNLSIFFLAAIFFAGSFLIGTLATPSGPATTNSTGYFSWNGTSTETFNLTGNFSNMSITVKGDGIGNVNITLTNPILLSTTVLPICLNMTNGGGCITATNLTTAFGVFTVFLTNVTTISGSNQNYTLQITQPSCASNADAGMFSFMYSCVNNKILTDCVSDSGQGSRCQSQGFCQNDYLRRFTWNSQFNGCALTSQVDDSKSFNPAMMTWLRGGNPFFFDRPFAGNGPQNLGVADLGAAFLAGNGSDVAFQLFFEGNYSNSTFCRTGGFNFTYLIFIDGDKNPSTGCSSFGDPTGCMPGASNRIVGNGTSNSTVFQFWNTSSNAFETNNSVSIVVDQSLACGTSPYILRIDPPQSALGITPSTQVGFIDMGVKITTTYPNGTIIDELVPGGGFGAGSVGCRQYDKNQQGCSNSVTQGLSCTWDSSFNQCKDDFSAINDCSHFSGICTDQTNCTTGTSFRPPGTWDSTTNACRESFFSGSISSCSSDCGGCFAQSSCEQSGGGQAGTCKWKTVDPVANISQCRSNYEQVCSNTNPTLCNDPQQCSSLGASFNWSNSLNMCLLTEMTNGTVAYGSGSFREICFNGVDDNGDGQIDCSDSTCFNSSAGSNAWQTADPACGGGFNPATFGHTIGGGFDPKDAMRDMMFKGGAIGPPVIIGTDPTNDSKVLTTPNGTDLDILGLGIKDMDQAFGLGIMTQTNTYAPHCQAYNGGAGNMTQKFFYAADSDNNVSTGCQLNYTFAGNSTNNTLSGIDYMYRYVINQTNATETMTAYKCANVSGSNKLILFGSRLATVPNSIKQFTCGAGDEKATILVVPKQDIGKSTPSSLKIPMKISVFTGNVTTSIGSIDNVIDALLGAYYTPGTADVKPTDCFANPSACGTAFAITGGGKYFPYEDCKTLGDEDNNGFSDCADPICAFVPECASSSSLYNASADKTSPSFFSTRAETQRDGAFIVTQTSKPTNLTLSFYSTSSTCSVLSSTLYDIGDPVFTGDDYRPFHGMPLFNGTQPQGNGSTVTLSITNDTIYYYKLTAFAQNGMKAVTSCLNYTTDSSTQARQVSFKPSFTPPAGNSLLTNGLNVNIKYPNGTALSQISANSSTTTSNVSILTNATIEILSSDGFGFTLLGANLAKAADINFTGAISMSSGSTSGFVSMNSSKWNEITQALGVTKLRVNTPGTDDVLKHCADDGVSNCTTITSESGVSKILTNTSGGYSVWEVPTTIGFSAYQGTTTAATTTSSSSSSGGSSGSGTTTTSSKESKVKPGLELNKGLSGNTKLQEALEKVLAKGKLSDQAKQNLLDLSATIAKDIEITRSATADTGKTKVTTKVKYNGSEKVNKFAFFDVIPKEFAAHVDNITITAPGATIEVVNADPEVLFVYDQLNSGQEFEITYELGKRLTASTARLNEIVESFASDVYGESLGEQPTQPDQPTEPEQPSEPSTQPEPMNPLLIVGVVVVVIVVLVAVSIKMKSSPKKKK